MKSQVDNRIVRQIRTQREAERLVDLVKILAAKIRATNRSLSLARSEYGLILKEDVPELIRVRQEVMNWQVRQRVLVEVWEEATGKVWQSGATRDE